MTYDDQQKQINKAVKEKQEFISKVVSQKEENIEKANVLNNAVVFWKTIRENNLNEDEELKNLIRVARKISRLKTLYLIDAEIDEIFRLLDQPF